MFKSIFSKYLATFTVILVCCITTILLAVSSRISHESYMVQKETMDASAGSTAHIVGNYIEENGYDNIYSAFLDKETGFQGFLEYTSDTSRAEIYLFDYRGVLISTSDDKMLHGSRKAYLSEKARNVMSAGSGNYTISTVEGLFPSNHFNSYKVAFSDGRPLYVISSRTDYTGLVFNRDIVIVTVTVALWVFLAAMLSLYVVSRRTTEPLSQIISAAKSYSKGRFNQKIEVTGQDEVAELAEAINNMATSLKQIDDERNAFIGNVSHDLRTPMTTISGFVDGILDGTIPPEKHGYYLNVISQEVRRLSRLVNTLLEVSRLESGTDLKMTDFNLSETARTVLISLESKISKKDIDIDFINPEDDVFVNADKDSIHRVIFNLMDNAVKFTPIKGKITITVATVADSKKTEKALFVIRNTGEGIPKEELPHIFDRFYKTDRSRGLDKSGTGLGLYIAKTSVADHDEDLTVTSVEGEYTEFRFNLSLATVTPRAKKIIIKE